MRLLSFYLYAMRDDYSNNLWKSRFAPNLAIAALIFIIVAILAGIDWLFNLGLFTAYFK